MYSVHGKRYLLYIQDRRNRKTFVKWNMILSDTKYVSIAAMFANMIYLHCCHVEESKQRN